MPIARLAPELELPPYGYVPGRSPHPTRDPFGHRYGQNDDGFGPAPDDRDWRVSSWYRHALDLFNHGYYWEAHEALEKWWRETPAGDPRRPFFQGLLRLAAAGVKAREGRPHGVRVHAERAAVLLRQAAAASGRSCFLGLNLAITARLADVISARAGDFRHPGGATADPILAVALTPSMALD